MVANLNTAASAPQFLQSPAFSDARAVSPLPLQPGVQTEVARIRAEFGPDVIISITPEFQTAPNGEAVVASYQITSSGSALAADATSRLTPEEQQVVTELRARDLEVRIHEAQHFRNSGGLAVGGPQYIFTQGPDGKYYAIGGSVNLRSTSTSDPEQATRDAITFQNAALAPGDASQQDLLTARNAFFNALGQNRAAQNVEQNEAANGADDSFNRPQNSIDISA